MIDIALLRERPDELSASLARRGIAVDLDELAALDEQRRSVRSQAEDLRAKQNDLGKSIPTLEGDARSAAIAEASSIAASYKDLLSRADKLDEAFNEQWIKLPNMTDPTAADGLTEDDAIELSRYSEPPVFDFPVLDHLDLGTALGVLDTDRAAKVSGSRFGFILGKLAMVEFSLIRYAMDNLVGHGFTPVVPPVLVREHALYGTGFFPGTAEQVYAVPEDDLFLVGTSEVPIAAFHGDEIFEAGHLPIRYAGYSTCFRREAGTYGKDTRGIFRVHQFDKVEMFSFVEPELSGEEHDFLLAREEEIIRGLDLPYRVVNVAAGDLGDSAAKKYDIEAWFPAQERYREITSTSNTTDYQSRRLRIRYRSDRGNRFVHTLNGTAIAVGRILIALMENNQHADGSISIPPKLAVYTGFDTIGPP
ncbi:MAG TPA: serine--tRNA ligase [Acidimicrobiia bacterium]|nr:serine--tRNA ligase [Acidimicrobiia bacterium]